jgi:DNA (cytosine-5)-methyltransferase 1
MKAISLFSGGGGMDFALHQSGIDVVYSNDISISACETLSRYFPHTDVVQGDIRDLVSFPDVDLVVGGYPCQSFSLAGNRRPSNDPRTYLFREFARVISTVKPKYFIAENVSGMAGVESGIWFKEQIKLYNELGYYVSHSVINARDYGVPQRRKRILIVGVRRDLGKFYRFPDRTHASKKEIRNLSNLLPYASHGEAIKHLPLDAKGEYYERPHDPDGHMSWYYMSRNRKANWFEPSFCIVANFRHVTLHPASETMTLTWSNLADGFKQRWDFSGEYEHTRIDPTLPVLEVPRRLSWRESAAIQTFPENYEPAGDLQQKFEQIGNAVPPMLFRAILAPILQGHGLVEISDIDTNESSEEKQLFLF